MTTQKGGCTAAERFPPPPPLIRWVSESDLRAKEARERDQATQAWERREARAGSPILGLPATLTQDWWQDYRARKLEWLVELAGRQKAHAWHLAGEMEASGFYGPLRDDLAAAMRAKAAP